MSNVLREESKNISKRIKSLTFVNDARDQELEGLKKSEKIKRKEVYRWPYQEFYKNFFYSFFWKHIPISSGKFLFQTGTVLIKQQQEWTLHLELVSTPYHPAEQWIWKQTVQTDNQTPEWCFSKVKLWKKTFSTRVTLPKGYEPRNIGINFPYYSGLNSIPQNVCSLGTSEYDLI